MMLYQILEELYVGGGAPERVGFVIGNEIIEVENVCNLPTEGFQVSSDDIMKYAEIADATWHTHPDKDANLSSEDHVAFKNYPNLKHYIIGNDGVRCYEYDTVTKSITTVELEG